MVLFGFLRGQLLQLSLRRAQLLLLDLQLGLSAGPVTAGLGEVSFELGHLFLKVLLLLLELLALALVLLG